MAFFCRALEEISQRENIVTFLKQLSVLKTHMVLCVAYARDFCR